MKAIINLLYEEPYIHQESKTINDLGNVSIEGDFIIFTYLECYKEYFYKVSMKRVVSIIIT